MKSIIAAIALSTVFIGIPANAADKATITEQAQQKMQATFKNLQFTSFKPAPIDGLFELNAGGSIIYYHPAKELLFMGEIFTKQGESLTAKATKSGAQQAHNTLPLDQALTIGPDDAEIELIEFTDPNCGFCKSYDRFVNDGTKAKKIKRQVFFDPRGSEDSRQKVIHILCSKDQASAMEKIYLGIKPKIYLSCPEGEQTLKAHAVASKTAGTRGTPSFIIDGRLVLGFGPSVKKQIKL